MLQLTDALLLFRRLGVDATSLTKPEFTEAYFNLARRYHPDRNTRGAELMANINAARELIIKQQAYNQSQSSD
jgi:curved DNA-binding protein CbpA